MRRIILIIPLLLLFSCRQTREIVKEMPVEVVKDIYHNVYIHDTISTKDSVIVFTKHDTVFKEKYVSRYIEKQIMDTIIQHDSIPIVVTKTDTIIKKKTQWFPLWIALGILLATATFYMINKFKTTR